MRENPALIQPAQLAPGRKTGNLSQPFAPGYRPDFVRFRVYLVLGDRKALIQQVPKGAVWAEVGVFRGDFSQAVLELCAPSEYCMIDNWAALPEQNSFGDVTENFASFAGQIHWDHFGDDASDAQEKNFQYVTQRFAGNPTVRVIRENSFKGIAGLPDAHFDVMYIDANHQYEFVLRDMMEARRKLKPGAVLLMNDFYEGPGGAEQNLGVIGAVNTFVKRYEFHYIAMSHGSFADVALTDDPGSPFVREFLRNLNNSELTFIGISDVLVPNLRYKLLRKDTGQLRYVAML